MGLGKAVLSDVILGCGYNTRSYNREEKKKIYLPQSVDTFIIV